MAKAVCLGASHYLRNTFGSADIDLQVIVIIYMTYMSLDGNRNFSGVRRDTAVRR